MEIWTHLFGVELRGIKPSFSTASGRNKGELVQFTWHNGSQTVTRWFSNNNEVFVDTISTYSLVILQTKKDPFSGRENIPEKIRLVAQKWNINLILNSTGSQVGYGPEFPNSLAYYRHSMLEPEDQDENAYGMLDLILEDDK